MVSKFKYIISIIKRVFSKKGNQGLSFSGRYFVNKTGAKRLDEVANEAEYLLTSDSGFESFISNLKFIDEEGDVISGETLLSQLRLTFTNNIVRRRYNPFSSVISHVTSDSNNIYFNMSYKHDHKLFVSNLFHERLHTIGYTHNGRDLSSIPYSFGNAVLTYIKGAE